MKEELRLELAMLEELEEEGQLTPELYSRKIDVCFELHEILVNEEIYWLQQSHERWLLKGDLNTDYYHKIANGCKRENTIHSLRAGEVVIVGTDNLIAHATEFYKELFSPALGNQFHLDPDTWSDDEKFNEDDNRDLCREFTELEVREALFSMATNRAPGPDNILVEFYQACWEIVKDDIMSLFRNFHNGMLDVQRLNYGVITLLPKISGADKIQQFRPICLLRCPYKLITKVMDRRVEVYADKLISSTQNAFVKGRNIMDGVLSLHEILNYTHVKKKSGHSTKT